MRNNRKSTPTNTRNAKRVARKNKPVTRKATPTVTPDTNVVPLNTPVSRGTRARLVQAHKAKLAAEADAILQAAKAAEEKAKADAAYSPRDPMPVEELTALEKANREVIAFNSTLPEATVMEALKIEMDGNVPESITHCVNRWGITSIRTNNVCMTMAQFAPYHDILRDLGMDAKKVIAHYENSAEGKALDKAIEEAKGEAQKTDGLTRRKEYMIDQIGKAAMIVLKHDEALANGFVFSFEEFSIQLRIYHLRHLDLTMLFSIDNLAKLSFAGKRDMKEFAELSIDRKPRRTKAQIALDAAKAKADKEEEKRVANAGKDNQQGNHEDKSAPIITSVAALPNIMAQIDTMLTEERIEKLAAEDVKTQAVHLVGYVSKLFRPEKLSKSAELRGFASDILITLWGLLNVTSIEEARKIATHENDAPVDTAKSAAKGGKK